MTIKSLLLTLVTSLFFIQNTYTNNSFAKLKPLTNKNADDLCQNHLKNLDAKDKQIFLNTLALINTPITNETPAEIIEATLQCGKHIEEAIQASPALLDTLKQFNAGMEEIVILYYEHVKEKISNKNINPKDMDGFQKEFEQKMAELMEYISNVYYKVAYKYMQDDSNEISLTYLFDANGEIPATKRTRPLPVPSL